MDSKETMTGKTWTAYELSGMALDQKTALVVSGIAGSSPDETGSRRQWHLREKRYLFPRFN